MPRTSGAFIGYNALSATQSQVFFEDGTDTGIPVSAANPLPVTSVAGGSVTADTELPAAAALADATANPTTPLVGAGGLRYNGATWDRERGNTEGTLLASAARTVTTISVVQTNYNARGVLLHLEVVTYSGATTLTLRIRSIDPVSGDTLTLASTGAITPSTGYRLGLLLYPGVIAQAASNSVPLQFSGVLPRIWYAEVVHSDATAQTYSLGYSLIV